MGRLLFTVQRQLALPCLRSGPGVPPHHRKMFPLLALSATAALLFVYFLIPALWLHLIAVDDSDSTDPTRPLVASRPFIFLSYPFVSHQPTPNTTGNPFRETGQPANMAKLILLRHKVPIVSSHSLTLIN